MNPKDLIGKRLSGHHLDGWRNRETGKTSKGSYLIVRDILPWEEVRPTWKQWLRKDEKIVIATWRAKSGVTISRYYPLDLRHVLEDIHSGELRVLPSAPSDKLDISGASGPERFIIRKMVQEVRRLGIGGRLKVKMSPRSARNLLLRLEHLGIIVPHQYGLSYRRKHTKGTFIVRREKTAGLEHNLT